MTESGPDSRHVGSRDGPRTSAIVTAPLAWQSRDPDRIRALLGVLGLGGVVAVVAAPPEGTDRLVVASGTPTEALPDAPAGFPVVLGWATVDAERLVDGQPVERLPPDPHLGAFVWRPPTTPGVLVLEPSTEGRLAAMLARHGEGPAALYVTLDAERTRTTLASAADVGFGRTPEAPGPLGRERLVLGPARTDPAVVLVREVGGRTSASRSTRRIPSAR